MPGKTGIEWTEAVWNCVVGCTKVSQGCRFCYAKTIHDMRHKAYHEGKKVAPQYAEPFETVQLMPDRLKYPLSLQKPSRIFVNSVSDLFHDDVPDDFIDKVFAVMALCSRHIFQILTKRPARMKTYVAALKSPAGYARLEAAARGLGYTLKFEGIPLVPWPIPNIWLGTSVENQKAADERIPELLEVEAAVLFLSMEPLLEAVDIEYPKSIYGEKGPDMCCNGHECGCRGLPTEPPLLMTTSGRRIGWVIVGGESGDLLQVVRPMDPAWVIAIRKACKRWNIPFFFKQYGDWLKFTGNNGLIGDGRARVDGVAYAADRVEILREGSTGFISGYRVRVGTKRAGRQLEDRTWDEYPR